MKGIQLLKQFRRRNTKSACCIILKTQSKLPKCCLKNYLQCLHSQGTLLVGKLGSKLAPLMPSMSCTARSHAPAPLSTALEKLLRCAFPHLIKFSAKQSKWAPQMKGRICVDINSYTFVIINASWSNECMKSSLCKNKKLICMSVAGSWKSPSKPR